MPTPHHCDPILVTVHGMPTCLVEDVHMDFPTYGLNTAERAAHNARINAIQLLIVQEIEKGYELLPDVDVDYVVNFPADRRTDHGGTQIVVEIVTGSMDSAARRNGPDDSVVGDLTQRPHAFTEKLAETIAAHPLCYSAFSQAPFGRPLESVLVRLHDDYKRPVWGRWKRKTEEPR